MPTTVSKGDITATTKKQAQYAKENATDLCCQKQKGSIQ